MRTPFLHGEVPPFEWREGNEQQRGIRHTGVIENYDIRAVIGYILASYNFDPRQQQDSHHI